uniref:Variant surface glycoprotein 1125.1685 n=1 Tax=Trypanosoma brucei TaxID=5691 RepID=A0A1J0R7T5_9TRYP|nr:variant surface glycoprotein 1125.1685 [Trypanosoma brucei]
MIQALALGLVVSVLTTIPALATLAIYKAESTTPCDEIVFLTKLIDEYTQKALSTFTQEQTLQDEVQILQQAACKFAGEEQAKRFQALHALALLKLQAARQQTQQATNILEATKILEARRAQLRLLLHNNQIAKPTLASTRASTNLPGYKSGNTNTYCEITATFPSKDFEACDKPPAGRSRITWAAENLKEVDALKLTDDKHFKPTVRTTKVLVVGTEASATTTATYPGFCHNGGTNVADATDLLGLTPLEPAHKQYTLTETKIGTTATKGAACTADLGGEAYNTKTHTVTAAQTAQAICKLRDHTVTYITSIGDETGDTLTQNEHMQQIADLILKGEVPKGQAGDKQKESVKTLFGDLKGSVSDKLLKPLATAEIQYTLKGDTKKHKVGADSNTENVHYAVAACYHNKLKKMQEVTEISMPQQTKDEDCAGKGKDKCNSDYCELKGDKCVAREGVKAEGKDGKTANTTGSNLFVIHKAPLWLAFVLL